MLQARVLLFISSQAHKWVVSSNASHVLLIFPSGAGQTGHRDKGSLTLEGA